VPARRSFGGSLQQFAALFAQAVASLLGGEREDVGADAGVVVSLEDAVCAAADDLRGADRAELLDQAREQSGQPPSV